MALYRSVNALPFLFKQLQPNSSIRVGTFRKHTICSYAFLIVAHIDARLRFCIENEAL